MDKQFWIILSIFFISLPVISLEKENPNQSLRNSIIFLNLYHNLYLSSDQIERLLEIGKKGHTMREEVEKQIGELENQLRKPLSKLNSEFLERGKVSPETEKEVKNLLDRIHAIKDHAEREGRALIMSLKDILTLDQIKTIDKYVPCIIPRKNPGSPELIGGAPPSSVLMSQLERIRKLPERIYERRKIAILERYVTKLKEKNLPDEEINELRKNFAEIIDEVRDMDDVEFNIEKERLVEKIAPEELLSPHNLKNITFNLQLFMSEETLSILERKLEDMKKSHS